MTSPPWETTICPARSAGRGAARRWQADFEKEDYKPEVVEKVLYQNAQRVLSLKV